MSDNWHDFADNIVSLVQDAVDNRDFSNLSGELRNVVNNIKIVPENKNSDVEKTTNNGYQQQVYHGVDDVGNDRQGQDSAYDYYDSEDKNDTKNDGEYEYFKAGLENGKYNVILDAVTKGFKYDKNYPQKTVLSKNSLPGRVSAPINICLGGAIIFSNIFLQAIGDFVASVFDGIGLVAIKSFLDTGFGLISWALIIVAFLLIVTGIKRIKLNSNFVKYVSNIDGNTYYDIKKLAIKTDQKKKKVLKNLNRMIKDGYFVEGHIDDDNTTLILTDDVYKEYLDNKERQKAYAAIEKNEKALKHEKKDRAVKLNKKESEADIGAENIHDDDTKPESETEKAISEGVQYIEYVHHCNELIKDEAMSKKLYVLEDIITHIFDVLKKDSSKTEEMHRLMDYYLPTTKKLLEAYIEFDNQPSYGDNNISNTKQEIEDAIDVINEAFGRLFDSMFEEKAWDISSDIKTMKTMMANDGLTDDANI